MKDEIIFNFPPWNIAQAYATGIVNIPGST